MNPLRFSKLSGAGNDFLIFEARTETLPPIDRLARQLCPRRCIGADGVMVISPIEADRIHVAFANADGSVAEFCGNGARCVARYAFEVGLATNPMWLEFPGKTVRALVSSERVEIGLALAPQAPQRLTLKDADGAPLEAWLVDGGAPHAILLERTPPLDLQALAQRHRDLYQRANLTALKEVEPGVVAIRTYERGVGETAACGSAAIAAGSWVAHRDGASRRLDVLPPSGVRLQVEVDLERNQALLSGDARRLYDGAVAEELVATLG